MTTITKFFDEANKAEAYAKADKARAEAYKADKARAEAYKAYAEAFDAYQKTLAVAYKAEAIELKGNT